ncbi:MAG: zinc-binding alcohol dehydrogenase family protein [Bacteroidota bacterium]|nr:zinc-binding alcohol dehydrogenase family protein [Bacteroidota bacterium]MDP4248723.1 zinc-binding alcohol dehydrogenase family protein [Bacteroidota bacterium]
MKSLVCTKPGVFEYQEADMPVLLPGYAILKIQRIGICGTDLHAFEGTQPYFSYPRILGHELAGDLVEMSGSGDFKTGEAITIIPYFNCGHCIACRTGKPNCCASINVCGVHSDGGMAEYFQVPDYALVHGDGLAYDQLAMVEPFAIGAHGIRRSSVAAGEFVLVVGSGPIGLGAMEFARIAGAEVIALDFNEQRLQFCRDVLNIPHVIRAGSDNVMEQLKEITHADMPSVVIDATGNKKAIEKGLDYLAHGGRYTLIGLQKENICFSHPEFHKRETTLMSSRNATRKDFEQVIDAIKRGSINPSSYISHRVSFDKVKDVFGNWLNPASGALKPMIEME